VEAFEPVIIEQIQVTEEPEEETEPVTEPATEPATFPVVEISPPRIDCPLDDETQQMILERCEELDLDFAFTMAVIFKESSFRPNADSGSSVGLMQINRINHKWLSEELGITDFFDPEQNVKAGTHMLRLLFEKYEDAGMVLMAYNMGESGARKLWNKGIYMTDYAEGVFQQADKYNQEIAERMGENAEM
jgi:soluble lytic murein transglycosylase-like protein